MFKSGNQLVACPKCNHGVFLEHDENGKRVVRYDECDLCYNTGLVREHVYHAYQAKIARGFIEKYRR